MCLQPTDQGLWCYRQIKTVGSAGGHVGPNDFMNSAQGFTKSPLGIIALFIVLVYGFASMVVGLGQGLAGHILPLIYFMVLFPVLVFFGFLWLVAKHHNKLYGPSDFRNEDNFLRAQMASAASLATAAAKYSGASPSSAPAQLQGILDAVSKSAKQMKHGHWRNRVLWVDDRPENNVHERQAFEAQGVEFSLALSTDEALDLMDSTKFAAVISDMGRKEGPQEGYALLEQMRKRGHTTPFVIYAGSNQPEHKQLARERGAIGSTNRADELFQLVMTAISNGT